MSMLRRIVRIASNLMRSSGLKILKLENVSNSNITQAGRDIIINQGLVEQLHQTFKKFDFVKASGQIDSIKRMMNVSDDFEISFDTAKAKVIKMKPKKSDGNPEGVINITAVFALPREYECFKTFEELMRHLFYKQKTIKVKAVSFKTLIGCETIFECIRELDDDAYLLNAELITQVGMDVLIQEKTSDIIIEEVVITPPKFSAPVPYFLETVGGAQGITLLLGLQEIEDTDDYFTYILSNKDQDFPIKISFKLNIPKRTTPNINIPVDLNYSFVLEEQAGKYHKVLVSRLFLAMKETQRLILRDPVTGKVVCEGQGIRLKEQDYEYFRFWTQIDDIDKTFGVDLILPSVVTKNDWKALNQLSEIIKNGKITESFTDFTATINEAASVANLVSYGGSDPITIAVRRNAVIELFGQSLDVGLQLLYTPPLKLIDIKVESPQKEFNSIQEGDSVEVKFMPYYERQQVLMVYPKFYGTDNEEEIMKKENLPGRWAQHRLSTHGT